MWRFARAHSSGIAALLALISVVSGLRAPAFGLCEAGQASWCWTDGAYSVSDEPACVVTDANSVAGSVPVIDTMAVINVRNDRPFVGIRMGQARGARAPC